MKFYSWRGGHLTGVLFLFIIGVIFAPAQGGIHAATFDVGCDVAELTAAIDAANTNGEGDIINLAAGCTYTLAATLVIADDGALVINGNGASISGNNAVMVLEVETGANLTLNNISIINGDDDAAGGLWNSDGVVVINNSTFSGNTSQNHGGILNSGGSLTVNGSTFSNNVGSSFAGGILSSGGTLNINNSTFTGNQVTAAGANVGGGAVVFGANSNGDVTNSTFFGNSSNSLGAALEVQPNADVNIINSTITGNTATSGSAFNARPGSNANVINTIVANNTGSNCWQAVPTFTNSLVDDDSCGVPAVASAALELGAFNGVFVPIGENSIAVGAGNPAFCPATDQIGTARKSPCDAGAVEAESAAIFESSQPPPPMANVWPGDEFTAYAVPDGFYANILMLNNVWQTQPGGISQGLIDHFVIVGIELFHLSGTISFGAHVPVCLNGEGRLIYLDAANAPRIAIELATFSSDGYTCGYVPNAGTLVLIQDNN